MERLISVFAMGLCLGGGMAVASEPIEYQEIQDSQSVTAAGGHDAMKEPFAFPGDYDRGAVFRIGDTEDDAMIAPGTARHLVIRGKFMTRDLMPLYGNAQIESLYVDEELTYDQALILADLDFWPTVRHVTLAKCRTSKETAHILAKAFERTEGLETLSLSKTPYAALLLQGAPKGTLKNVRLSRLPLQRLTEEERRDVVDTLAGSLAQVASLHALDVSKNELHDEELSMLLRNVSTSLHVLNIGSNQTGHYKSVGKETFETVKHFCALRALDLQNLQLTNSKAQFVRTALQELPCLRYLDLSNNASGDGALGRMLEGASPRLAHLRMNATYYMSAQDWSVVAAFQDLVSLYATDCDTRNLAPTCEEETFCAMGEACETFITPRVTYKDGRLLINNVEIVM